MTGSKPKSPPTPSRSLTDSFADVKKLYEEYSHGQFAKSEIASALSVSANSGPFAGRLFTLKAFGLLDQSGSDYSVSDLFKKLDASDHDSPEFKQAALRAIKRSPVFDELLNDFKSKLPSKPAVTKRLETQMRFNAKRAARVAEVLEESLRFAGVLDGSNNILPVRANGRPRGEEASAEEKTDGQTPEDALTSDDTDTLSVEIPVGEDRKVLIRYPRDLNGDEAKKVGAVLNAIVG
jgi:hypothetical protein